MTEFEKSYAAIIAADFAGDPESVKAALDAFASMPVVPGRIVCPHCDGIGRRYDVDEVGEPCMPCREDGYLDPGDDSYPDLRTEHGMVEYPDPIQWGQDGGKTFDKAYDHTWERVNEWGTKACSACGMRENEWTGHPCTAKAEQVSFWIPRA